ncbi:MAG: hypothetical protein AAGG75_12740 [Bacteroidota bacterium]
MKNKKTTSALFVALALTIGSLTIQAQQTWVWKANEVNVELSENFKINKNSKNEFKAEGDGIELYMFIFEENMSLEQMKAATELAATEMELEQADVIKDISTSDFSGQYITGYKEEDAVILCGMVKPGEGINFFVAITFDNDDGVAQGHAFELLRSLRL